MCIKNYATHPLPRRAAAGAGGGPESAVSPEGRLDSVWPTDQAGVRDGKGPPDASAVPARFGAGPFPPWRLCSVGPSLPLLRSLSGAARVLSLFGLGPADDPAFCGRFVERRGAGRRGRGGRGVSGQLRKTTVCVSRGIRGAKAAAAPLSDKQ